MKLVGSEVVVSVCPDDIYMYWREQWRDVAQNIVNMTVKESLREILGKVIRHVDFGVNVFQEN